QLFRSVPCRLAALASLIGMGAEQVLTLARTIRLQSQWADPSPRRLLLLIIEPTVRRARHLHTKRGMGVGAAALRAWIKHSFFSGVQRTYFSGKQSKVQDVCLSTLFLRPQRLNERLLHLSPSWRSPAYLDALPPVQRPPLHTCLAPAWFDLFARSVLQR